MELKAEAGRTAIFTGGGAVSGRVCTLPDWKITPPPRFVSLHFTPIRAFEMHIGKKKNYDVLFSPPPLPSGFISSLEASALRWCLHLCHPADCKISREKNYFFFLHGSPPTQTFSIEMTAFLKCWLFSHFWKHITEKWKLLWGGEVGCCPCVCCEASVGTLLISFVLLLSWPWTIVIPLCLRND